MWKMDKKLLALLRIVLSICAVFSAVMLTSGFRSDGLLKKVNAAPKVDAAGKAATTDNNKNKIVILKEGKVTEACCDENELETDDLLTITSEKKAIEIDDKIKIGKLKNCYLPYLQGGGGRFFRAAETGAMSVDLFIPLWQRNATDLVFTDLRIFDKSGPAFEGNVHLGYRHLFPERKQILGIYGAFDRKKTANGSYFNQLTIGGEYWLEKIFMGMNFYKPIGNTSQVIGFSNGRVIETPSSLLAPSYRSVVVTQDRISERAMAGVDFEMGYEAYEGLVGYVGGYYFKASDTAAVCGPRARLTYDWFVDSKKGLLKMIDKFGLEAGVQNDKQRGTTWYLTANVRLDLWPSEKTLHGMSRHMVDLVRRDQDVVVGSASDLIFHRPLKMKTVISAKDLEEALAELDLDIIYIPNNHIISAFDVSKVRQVNNKDRLYIVIDDRVTHKHIGKMLGNDTLDETVSISINGGNITQNTYNQLTDLGYQIIHLEKKPLPDSVLPSNSTKPEPPFSFKQDSSVVKRQKSYAEEVKEWRERRYGKVRNKKIVDGIEVTTHTPAEYEEMRRRINIDSQMEP